jgi:hypothetical protein
VLTEAVTAEATLDPSGSTYNVAIIEIAAAVAEVNARLLWELIDDEQAVSWQNINNAQSSGWQTISNVDSTDWSIVETT